MHAYMHAVSLFRGMASLSIKKKPCMHTFLYIDVCGSVDMQYSRCILSLAHVLLTSHLRLTLTTKRTKKSHKFCQHTYALCPKTHTHTHTPCSIRVNIHTHTNAACPMPINIHTHTLCTTHAGARAPHIPGTNLHSRRNQELRAIQRGSRLSRQTCQYCKKYGGNQRRKQGACRRVCMLVRCFAANAGVPIAAVQNR
jgi:hypothetical protein